MSHLLCVMLIWATLSGTSASGLGQSTGVVIVSRGGVQALAGKAEYTGARAAIGGSPVAGAAAANGIAGALGGHVGWPIAGVMAGAVGGAIGYEGKSAVLMSSGGANMAALFRAVKADYFLIDTVTGCIYGMVGGAVGGGKGGAVGGMKLSKITGDVLGGSKVGKCLGKLVGAAVGGVTGVVTGAAAGCLWGGEYGGKAGGKVGTTVGGAAGMLWVLDPTKAEEIAKKCLNEAFEKGTFCVNWKAMMDALEEGGQTGAETGREWEEWAKETYH